LPGAGQSQNRRAQAERSSSKAGDSRRSTDLNAREQTVQQAIQGKADRLLLHDGITQAALLPPEFDDGGHAVGHVLFVLGDEAA